MSINNRTDFINKTASEKIVLAHIHANSRLVVWTNYSGNIWQKSTSYFVNKLKVENTALTKVTTLGTVTNGSFFYDSETSIVYTELSDSSDPNDSELICQYRLFYSNAPISASYDLSDTSNHVYYDGRITKNPTFSHKVGIEQQLSSVVGTGKLVLENTDGTLDEIYDTFIFENQDINVYSWNRNIPFSEAQIIYRGRVTNKGYSSNSVSFTLKDKLFDLLQSVPQTVYSDSDTVSDSVKGTYKRWVYGRVDGLKLQSVDQIADGYSITGTVSNVTDSIAVSGNGTNFLSELSPGDVLTISTLEVEIDTIISNTSLTLVESPDYPFSGLTATVVPLISTTSKNREYFVAEHATAKVQTTVSDVLQFNRIGVVDTLDLSSGDIVQFTTGDSIEIKSIAPNNVLVLRQNVTTLPTVGTTVTRESVQKVYIKGVKVPQSSYTVSNTSTDTRITFDSTVEFDIARNKNLNVDLTFTNVSRTVTTSSILDLRDIIKVRDFIRPTDITYTTYYEVLNVTESSLTLRTTFSDPTHTGSSEGKSPDYLTDTTIVSGDVLGRTVDGTPTGTWLKTGASIINDLLSEIGITDINASSFTTAETDASQLMSISIPTNPTSTLTSTKSVVDKINKSIHGALTLDNSLDLKYKIFTAETTDTPTTVKDSDLKSWSVKATNGKTYRDSIIKYRHQDVKNDTLEAGNSVKTYTSDFVTNYIDTSKSIELDVFIYNSSDAEISSHRNLYHNELGRATFTLKSDLRLEDVQIGDTIMLDLERLYKRFGDSTTRKKLVYVIGKSVSGLEITFTCSDLGNTMNTACIITPNTTSDFNVATDEEKLKYGYITDTRGIVDDDEDTQHINLIT